MEVLAELKDSTKCRVHRPIRNIKVWEQDGYKRKFNYSNDIYSERHHRFTQKVKINRSKAKSRLKSIVLNGGE